jgi:hypothetical protein
MIASVEKPSGRRKATAGAAEAGGPRATVPALNVANASTAMTRRTRSLRRLAFSITTITTTVLTPSDAGKTEAT